MLLARAECRKCGVHACMFGFSDADDTRSCIFLRGFGYEEERTDGHDPKLRVVVLDNNIVVLHWLFDVLRTDLARPYR